MVQVGTLPRSQKPPEVIPPFTPQHPTLLAPPYFMHPCEVMRLWTEMLVT